MKFRRSGNHCTGFRYVCITFFAHKKSLPANSSRASSALRQFSSPRAAHPPGGFGRMFSIRPKKEPCAGWGDLLLRLDSFLFLSILIYHLPDWKDRFLLVPGFVLFPPCLFSISYNLGDFTVTFLLTSS